MYEKITRERIEDILQLRIQDLKHYERAFTHKSSTRDGKESYELDEFLGDAALGLIVAVYLLEKFPGKNEGFLTRVRTKLVNGETLSRFAKELGLSRHICMNYRAMSNGWNMNDKMLEDVFEALIGAIYKDIGLRFARQFVIRVIEQYVNFDTLLLDTNYKDILMRHTQAIAIPLPEYRMVEDRNEQNQKIFRIFVYVDTLLQGTGVGINKKQAEQSAAKQALINIGLFCHDNPNIIE
jgi:ribonuclease III